MDNSQKIQSVLFDENTNMVQVTFENGGRLQMDGIWMSAFLNTILLEKQKAEQKEKTT